MPKKKKKEKKKERKMERRICWALHAGCSQSKIFPMMTKNGKKFLIVSPINHIGQHYQTKCR